MVEYLQSFGEHLLFKKNENEIIMGGYSIDEIAKTQLKIGGMKQEDDFGLSRFKDLAVPLGLYLEKDLNEIIGGSQPHNKNFIEGGTIPDDQFNKLFDMVAVLNARGGLSKKYSRKNKDIQSKKSTKNKTKKFDE